MNKINQTYEKKNIQVFVYYVSSLNIKNNSPFFEFLNEDELNNWILRLIPNKKIEILDLTVLNFITKLPIYSINDHETIFADFITKNPQYMNENVNSIFDAIKTNSQYGYFVINNPQLFPDNIKTHIFQNSFNIIENYELLKEVKINNNSRKEYGFTEYFLNL